MEGVCVAANVAARIRRCAVPHRRAGPCLPPATACCYCAAGICEYMSQKKNKELEKIKEEEEKKDPDPNPPKDWQMLPFDPCPSDCGQPESQLTREVTCETKVEADCDAAVKPDATKTCEARARWVQAFLGAGSSAASPPSDSPRRRAPPRAPASAHASSPSCPVPARPPRSAGSRATGLRARPNVGRSGVRACSASSASRVPSSSDTPRAARGR